MGHTVVVLRVYGTKGTAQLLHNVMIVMIERAINNCTVYYIQSSPPPPRPLPPPPPHTAPPSPENGAIGGGGRGSTLPLPILIPTGAGLLGR